MAYRVECKKTVKEAIDNLVEFLSNPVSMETSYDLAQGDGNIENITFNPDTVVTETWEIKYDATNDVFKVTGSVSGAKDDAQIDQAYDNGIISFTIRQGENEWQDGDIVTIDVIKGSSKPFKVLANFEENDVEVNKAWIAGTYGFDVTYTHIIGSVGRTQNFNKYKNKKIYFSRGGNIGATHYSFEKIAPFRNGRVYCSDINSSSHSIDGDVTLVLHAQFGELVKADLSNNYYINRMYISNFTSDYYTSEKNFYIQTDLRDGNLYFDDEVLCNIVDIVEGKGPVTLVVLINSTEGKLSVYVDGVKVVDNLQNDKWKNFKGLFGKQIDAPVYVSSYYVWDRLLTEEEINSFDENGFPPKELNDFYISLFNDTGLYKNVLLQTNKSGFLQIKNNEIRFFNVVNFIGETEDYLQSLNSSIYVVPNYEWNYQMNRATNVSFNENINFYIPKLHWGLHNEMIEKYWYVTDGEDILIVLKKYDPSQTENPTYQIFYLGWGEGDKTYDLPFVLGWGGNNAYDVNNDSFRFGLMYNDNTSFWNGTSWVNNYVSDGALSGEWREIINDNQSISVIKVNKYRNIADDLKIINFGSPKWLYLINFTEIQPETEVYINGVKHIVIPDNHIKAPYNYLVELNEE